ncbi:MAG: antiterminator LoaP [Spirochaetota bacterium]
MPYYAIHVKARCEEKFLHRAGTRMDKARGKLVWPRRKLRIKKKGEWLDSLKPIFPGYLFLEAEEVSSDIYTTLRTIPGFLRFLPSNNSITPLNRDDRELLTHFLSFGEIVEKSQVFFDHNSRIRVVSGPLKGLEGKIVKVDRRKGRAKVKLDMCRNSFLIDFGFDALDRA